MKYFQKDLGEVAEWSNAPVLKTDVPKGTQGSNPCLSAIFYPWNPFFIRFSGVILGLQDKICTFICTFKLPKLMSWQQCLFSQYATPHPRLPLSIIFWSPAILYTLESVQTTRPPIALILVLIRNRLLLVVISPRTLHDFFTFYWQLIDALIARLIV